ncbi:uncharacterized protein LOC144104033 [Amblyomma americanum]
MTRSTPCYMQHLLVLTLALVATGMESESHARHWRNYLNGILAQLAQGSPKPDQRHELWKQLLSGRVRSFLVGGDDDLTGETDVGAGEDYYHFNYGGELPLKLDNGVPNGDQLSDAWRKQVADTLLAPPVLVQRHRHTTSAASPVEAFSPYRHPTTRRTTKVLSTISTESPHLGQFLDIVNAHGARHLHEPSPQAPLICRCSPGKNGSSNGSSDVVVAKLMTSAKTTREPPLLLVVPGLMVVPRDGPFAVVLENKGTNASGPPPQSALTPSSTSTPMQAAKLRRHRLRFVLLLVAFVVALSASLAYRMRSYLAKYKREYEIISTAQFI